MTTTTASNMSSLEELPLPSSSSDTDASGSNLEDRAVRVALRRATLGKPRKLPLRSSPLPDDTPIDEATQRMISEEVHRILREGKIQRRSPTPPTTGQANTDTLDGSDEATAEQSPFVTIVDRWEEDGCATGRPTILVESDWDEATSAAAWTTAIFQVQDVLEALPQQQKKQQTDTLGLNPDDIDIEFIPSASTCKVENDLWRHAKTTNDSFVDKYYDEVWRIVNAFPSIKGFLSCVLQRTLQTISYDAPWPLALTIYIDFECPDTDRLPAVQAVRAYLGREFPGIEFRVVMYTDMSGFPDYL